MRTVKKLLGLLVLLLLLWERGPDGRVLAAFTGDSPASDRFFQARTEDGVFGEMEDLGIQEEAQAIEDYLRQSLGRGQEDFSFISLMKYLLAGKLSEAALEAGKGLKNSLWGEIEAGGGLLLQVVLIGMVGAVFSSFASIFQGGQVSETGFFVTYLLLFACLAASFFASLQIAAQVLDQVFGFLQVLMPAYFMAVAFAGGSLSAAALYEAMLAAVAAVQWVCRGVLLPMVRIDVLLVLAGHVAREETLTRLTELLEDGVSWILKTMTGLVLGFHVIQSLVLPFADSAGQAGIRRLVEMIPGIGSGAGALTQAVLGSGVLIKNTMGAAAVTVLVLLTAVPIIKLTVLMVLYQAAAAVMQPVCDKRVVSCVSGIARGHGLLLKIVTASLMLFVVVIALTCAATNVNYYTV